MDIGLPLGSGSTGGHFQFDWRLEHKTIVPRPYPCSIPENDSRSGMCGQDRRPGQSIGRASEKFYPATLPLRSNIGKQSENLPPPQDSKHGEYTVAFGVVDSHSGRYSMALDQSLQHRLTDLTSDNIDGKSALREIGCHQFPIPEMTCHKQNAFASVESLLDILESFHRYGQPPEQSLGVL